MGSGVYVAVSWESILQGDVKEYGQYRILSVLQDKVARYLFEFHAESYTDLSLPALTNDLDSGRGVIDGLLNTRQELPLQIYWS